MRSPPPFWFMRQAGRYLPEYRALRSRAANFLDFCYRPELAIEASLQPFRRFRPDGVILFSDILVVADALGLAVDFVEGEGPRLGAGLDPKDVPAFDVTLLRRRLAPVYDTVCGLKAALAGEDAALIGFAGAPWTLAAYIVEGRSRPGFPAAKRWISEHPQALFRLIEVLTEATIEHLKAQIEAGAECLQLFDSWAGLLGQDAFARFSVAPARAIRSALEAFAPQVPLIGFPRGVAPAFYRRYARETGIEGISLDETVSLGEAQALQRIVAVQGNLAPAAAVAGGGVLEAAARSILETLGSGRLIFNLGHGVAKETDPAHIEALARLVRGWRR